MSGGQKQPKPEKKTYRIPPRSLTAAVLAAGVVLIAMNGMQASKFGDGVQLGLGPEWFEVVAWVNQHTNETEVVASWWDYGYWIETYADRTSIANGATIAEKNIRRLAQAFLFDEAEINQFCEDYDVSLFIVDVAMDVAQGKWGAMAHIAKVNPNDYLAQTEDNTMVISPTGQAAPIFRMASPVFFRRNRPEKRVHIRGPSPMTSQFCGYSGE